jgi:diaminopropionate ammonia-lyase family
MLIANPLSTRRHYDPELKAILNIATGRESRDWLAHWDMLSSVATPLRHMTGTAAQLGIGDLFIKDESLRSPLASFKALGAPVALLRLVRRSFTQENFEPRDLLCGRHAERLRGFTVISATDGNHGRALAAAARSVGCPCVIVLHAQVSPEREAPIAALGAQIVRIAGNYDDSIREAARLALINGWQVVSDTSYEGYESIPRDVMQGYSILADEALEAAAEPGAPEPPFSHVLLQGGVGGLAAGVVSHFWERYGAGRPTFIVVEPEQADCLLQSARHGRPSEASGSTDSLMAGLACGEASPLAWRFLEPAVDYFMTVSDGNAADAMCRLARGDNRDIPIVSGESGAATLAALADIAEDPVLARNVGLNRQSRLLLISTEGATAPQLYASLTGLAEEEVRQAQSLWTSSLRR